MDLEYCGMHQSMPAVLPLVREPERVVMLRFARTKNGQPERSGNQRARVCDGLSPKRRL